MTTAADPAAAQAYLALEETPLQIAHLAAAISPRQETLSPQAAADQAVALRMAAVDSLYRQRARMLSEMNYATLYHLALLLRVDDAIVKDLPALAGDPVKAPVIIALRVAHEVSSTATEDQNAAVIRRTLAAADARTGLPRPAAGALLEPALRYALDEPVLPWEDLRRVFFDFLAVETDHREPPVSGRPRMRLRLPVDKALRAAEQAFRAGFFPGLVIPPTIERSTAAKIDQHWPDDRAVSEDDLLCLVSDFHDFWVKHRVAYRTLFRETQELADVRSGAGALGGATTALKRRVEQTNGLIAYLQECGGFPAPDARASAAGDFVAGILRDRDAVKSARAFLGTLLTTLHDPRISTGEIRELMRSKPVRELDESTGKPVGPKVRNSQYVAAPEVPVVEACRALLLAAFPPASVPGKARGKKSKKPA